MLKHFAQQHHLVLRRGQNIKIIFTLVTNHFLWLFLQLWKSVRGIHRPIVHYYAVCWNEEAILPWVFDYYGDFVDRFYIYDNYSSDGTERIVNNNPKATLLKFGEEGQFDDSANQAVKNSCWKHSRGKADLVVVCDMDEFLYHKDLKQKLQEMCKHHISFPTTKGYEMYSVDWPIYDGTKRLPELVKVGVRSEWFDKHIVFDPYKIVDTNFDPGAHHANPTGIVNHGDAGTELKVLHYKYLGLQHLLARHEQLRERLSSYNLANDFGVHYYTVNKEKIEEQYVVGLKSAKQIVD